MHQGLPFVFTLVAGTGIDIETGRGGDCIYEGIVIRYIGTTLDH